MDAAVVKAVIDGQLKGLEDLLGIVASQKRSLPLPLPLSPSSSK